MVQWFYFLPYQNAFAIQTGHIMGQWIIQPEELIKCLVHEVGKRIYICFLQVVIGGGQEASQVTTSDRRAGKFEATFYHKVWLWP